MGASPSSPNTLDVLVIDEAGQMSLANVLAVSQAARSLVLLGDPQQLEQPLKASHPDGSAASVLQHVLEEHQTMPAERGLFIGETWRLAPAICSVHVRVVLRVAAPSATWARLPGRW